MRPPKKPETPSAQSRSFRFSGNVSYISSPKREDVDFISKNMCSAMATPTNKIKILKVKMKKLAEKNNPESNSAKFIIKRDKIEINKRKIVIVKSKKWDDFKERRLKMIDYYIDLRKK